MEAEPEAGRPDLDTDSRSSAHKLRYWRDTLAAAGRIKPVNVTATLCGLVGSAGVASGVKGAVLYESALPFGTGYTLPMALTLAAQASMLPVTKAMLAKHTCLGKLAVVHDLRIGKMPAMASRASAWRWAIDTLLPKSSRTTVFNLYHWGYSS